MAGTADSWRGTALNIGFGRFYGQLAVPGAGGRLTLDATTNTPDSIANPNAFHFGVTQSGAKLDIKVTYNDFQADEFRGPLATIVTSVAMSIDMSLEAGTDMDVVKNLLAGVGTYATGAGFKEVAIGSLTIAYQCVAHVFPLVEDPTKVGVFMIYNGINKTGVGFEQARTKQGVIPVNFMGYEVTTRALTDTLGKYWKQI